MFQNKLLLRRKIKHDHRVMLAKDTLLSSISVRFNTIKRSESWEL